MLFHVEPMDADKTTSNICVDYSISSFIRAPCAAVL